MGWTPVQQRKWIKEDLGPLLKERGYGNLKLMIHDDQRAQLPSWPTTVYRIKFWGYNRMFRKFSVPLKSKNEQFL